MTKKEAFFKLIGLFERENIRYALVGNTDEYPDRIGSDVDVMTDAEGMRRFHRAIWTMEEQGLRVVQRFQHEVTAFYYILAFRTDEGGWDFLQPDVCTDYYRRGRKILDAAPLLERRRKIPVPDCPGGGFFALSPSDEFAYYLIKKIGKTTLSDDQFRHLRETFICDPEGCRAAAARFGEAARTAAAAIEAGDTKRLFVSLPSLKRAISASGRIGRPRFFRDMVRKAGRVLDPTGFVAVLPAGADPSFAAGFHAILEHAFRRQADFSRRERGLFRKLLRAKIASTLVLLDGSPAGLSGILVDTRLDGTDPSGWSDSVLGALARRAERRYRPAGTGNRS